MGAAWIVAAVGFAAVVFMLGFLIALLREGAPSVCYWIVSGRRELETERHFLRSIDGDHVSHATECNGIYHLELLGNEGHAKECASGLTVVDVRPVSDRLGRRADHSRNKYALREGRLWFGRTN